MARLTYFIFTLCCLLAAGSQLSRRGRELDGLLKVGDNEVVEDDSETDGAADENAESDDGESDDSESDDSETDDAEVGDESSGEADGDEVVDGSGEEGTDAAPEAAETPEDSDDAEGESLLEVNHETSESSSDEEAAHGEPKKADASGKKDGGKKDSKTEDLNKKMPLKAQEQGFTGKKVEHINGTTGVSDWQKEYGSSRSFAQSSKVRADPKKAGAKAKKDSKASKKGSKIEDLNKKMPLKAQEQGFTGNKVEHVNGSTGVTDWQEEYGNSPSFTQAWKADPKNADAKAKKDGEEKGSKIEDLSKKMPLKAQEQGFTGKKVEHVNGSTGVSDWQKEYGSARSFAQSKQLRGHRNDADPKKGAADSKEDLMKPMPLKAQEQGYSGEKVQHDSMKTGTADWRDEYGHLATTAAPPAKKSGSMSSRSSLIIAALLMTCVLMQ